MGPENQAREIQSQTECEKSEAYLIGQLLKEAREEKRMTISEVAIETRIRQIYIKALEDGALDQLPGEIYKIGFLKTYASFLGLDTVEILRRLDLNQDVQVNYADNKYVIPTESQSQPSKKILYLSIIGALSFSIFAYVTHNSQNTEPNIESFIPEKQDSTSFAINDPALLQEATKLERDAEEEEASQESLPSDLTSEKDSTISLEKTPEAEPSIANSLSKDRNEQKVDALPTADNRHNITLKAVKDTWVQVLDGSEKTVYVRLMHENDVYEVPKQGGEYTLNTGNAGGLKVECNGKETKLLGTEGQVKRGIRLTESGLQDFY